MSGDSFEFYMDRLPRGWNSSLKNKCGSKFINHEECSINKDGDMVK